jgi:hypothetical protein
MCACALGPLRGSCRCRSRWRPADAHTELIQAISALNLLLNLFLNSGAESMVQPAAAAARGRRGGAARAAAAMQSSQAAGRQQGQQGQCELQL